LRLVILNKKLILEPEIEDRCSSIGASSNGVLQHNQTVLEPPV
jgi:hypothetical protein